MTFLLRSLALFYMLPCLLFLASWCHLWLATPLILVFLWGVSARLAPVERRCLAWKQGDAKKLLLAFFLIALEQAIVGYTGLWPQHDDFSARNAIYGTLCRQDWPVFSPEGHPLVYYLAGWLPSAALSKTAGFEWRDLLFQLQNTCVLCAAFLCACMAIGRVSLRILLAAAVLDAFPTLIGGRNWEFIMGYDWLGQMVQDYPLQMPILPNIVLQLSSTTNHAPFIILGTSLLLIKYERPSTPLLLLAGSLFVSPLGALGMLPLAIWQTIGGLQRKGSGFLPPLKPLLKAPEGYALLASGTIAAAYFTQVRVPGSVFLFLPVMFQGGAVWLLHAGMLLLTALLLGAMYWPARRKPVVWIAIGTLLAAGCFAYGFNCNEISRKVSLPAWVALATFFPYICRKGTPTLSRGLIVCFLLCFIAHKGRQIPYLFRTFRSPTAIVDPYGSDYYGTKAREARNSPNRTRDFGGMADSRPNALWPCFFRSFSSQETD